MTFTIDTDHPLVPLWPRSEHDPVDLLDASPVSWSALEVFRRRRTLQPSDVDDTTVIVTAIKRDEQAWSDLQTDIEEYLMNQAQPALQVEMIDGAISRYASGETPGTSIPWNQLEAPALELPESIGRAAHSVGLCV